MMLYGVRHNLSEDEILSGHLDTMNVETTFLKGLADEAREEARVSLQKAEFYRNAYDESKKSLLIAKRDNTQKLLDQARQGRDFQDDLVKHYSDVFEEEQKVLKTEDKLVERDLSEGEEEIEDMQLQDRNLEEVDVYEPINRQPIPRQLPEQKCIVPNSWVLESSTNKYQSATQCMDACFNKFVDKKDGTSRCSHLTYNNETRACVIYSNTDLKKVVVDKCSSDLNVKTVVLPGIACRGCTK